MSAPYYIGRLTRTRTNGERYWSYCIQWWAEGVRKRHTLDTTDKVVAESTARRIWATFAAPVSLVTVGDMVGAYLGPVDRTDKVAGDKRKREAWVAASPYWAALQPSQIDEQVSLAYPAWRNRAANTCRNELALIRLALKWAEKNKHLDKAPDITLPPMPESKVGHLTKEEFRTYLKGCAAPHVRLFSMLGIATGGRKSAILETKWDQVDLERQILDLNPDGRQQNSKFRATVPLTDMVMPALREAKAAALTEFVIEHHGKPLLDIKKGVAAASVRSGIKVHPHMFRHSAAVWMAEDRVPMAEIASFLGHRDISVTTRIYARYNPDYLRGAARSLAW